MPTMFTMPFRPAYDSNGRFIAGAKAYFTLTGTNTTSPVYTSSALTTPLANPIVANASGRFPVAYLNPAITYRVRIYSAAGIPGVSTPLEEYDPYVAAEQGTTGLQGIQGLPGAGGGGGGAAPDIGLFSAAGGVVIAAGTNAVQTSGRTVAGVHPGRYVRSAAANQTLYTTAGSAFITGVTAEGAPQIALAQAAILAILNRIRFVDSTGSYWEIDDSGQDAHAGHFGAIADATYNETTGVITGTDASLAINALINWRKYLKAGTSSENKKILIPSGYFRCDSPIEFGFGDALRSFVVEGAAGGYGNTLSGTVLYKNFDGYLFGVHAVRSTRIKNISGWGDRSYQLAKGHGNLGNPAYTSFGIDDRYITAWHDPAKPLRNALLRYNPDCFIAVDPFVGTAPAAATAWATSTAVAKGVYKTANSKLYIALVAGTTASSGGGPTAVLGEITDGTVVWAYIGASSVAIAYPTPAIPAFLPLAQRIGYGRSGGSSDIVVSDGSAIGFSVGMVDQPNGSVGNGDFIEFRDWQFTNVTVPFSITGTQTRQVGGQRVGTAFAHTLFTNRMHGGQNGTMGGAFYNCNGAAVDTVLDGNADFLFDNFNIEGFQRISKTAGGGLNGSSLSIRNCQFTFNHQITTGARGVPLSQTSNPRSILEGAGSAHVIRFVDSYMQSFSGALPLYGNVVMEDVFVSEQLYGQAAPPNYATARFINTTAGGVIASYTIPQNDQLIRYNSPNETSFGLQSAATNARNQRTSRDNPASWYTPSMSPLNGASREEIHNPQPKDTFDKSGFTGVSLTGRTLAFTYAQSLALMKAKGLSVGTPLIDANGMIFRVDSATGTSTTIISATLMNGYDYLTGTIAYEQPFVTTSGLITMLVGGIFTPNYGLYADISTASTTVSNAKRPDGYGGWINTSSGNPFQVGDMPYTDGTTNTEYNLWGQVVVVSALGAGSWTMNSVANVTVTGQRIKLFMRVAA